MKIVFVAGDYAVFALMLVISLGIGIYHGVRERMSRKKDVQNYLMGGRNMSPWAVGISVSLSFVSAVTVLGVPAEIYLFGSMYLWLIGALVILVPVCTEIYIPIYFRTGVTSCYEYLQLRFNYAMRLIGTAAYIVQTSFYIGVMIYAPSLALGQVSGFSLWGAIFATGIVCTIYTTIGGLKAVIWTDVFQGIVLVIVLMVVMFVSAEQSGGWDAVWEANHRGGRIDFARFDLDPRVRHTVWSLVIGLGFLWTGIFCTTQAQVQRYLACSTPANAKISLYVGGAVSVICVLLTYFLGAVMYAYFQNCDPLISKQVTAADQLLPLMVLQVFQNAPGAAGVFVAGVYAGSLSTVSSGINALACVTLQDFIKPFTKWSESKYTICSKCLVFSYGILCIGFACLSTTLGSVLQTSLSLLGIIGGPLLALFTLGIVFPFANPLGSGIGFFTGLALTSWIYGGSQNYNRAPQELFKYLRPKPRSISGCAVETSTMLLNSTMNFTTSQMTSSFETTTMITPAATIRPAEADLYLVSYAYYTPIGFGAAVLVGVIVSLLTCGHRHSKEVNPNLLVPLFDHKMFIGLSRKFRKMMRCGADHDQVNLDKPVPIEGIDNTAMEINERPTKRAPTSDRIQDTGIMETPHKNEMHEMEEEATKV